MTISKRKPTATAARAPSARRPAAAKPAAPTKAAVEPAVSPTPARAPSTPLPPGNDEKRIRASFSLPESQITLLGELKKRCLGFGVNVKKGELLTAGLQLLKHLPDTALEAAVLPSMRSDRQRKVAKQRKK